MKVMVYSKCMNDVSFSQYQHFKDDKGMLVSKPFNTLVIKGLNTYLRENGYKLFFNKRLAKTEVSKEIWDIIYNERKDSDSLFYDMQIFTAKNDNEAYALLNDIPAHISDILTDTEMKKKSSMQKKMLY